MLILALWPLPVEKQPDDPTWNYCGLVTNAAMHIGLHAPSKEREYGFPRATAKDIELRSRTMLQVFNLNVLFSTRIGVSPPLADEVNLRNIVHLCSNTSLERDASYQTEISIVLARYTRLLELDRTGDMRPSLIQVGCAALEDLRDTNGKRWTTSTELQFWGAKMFLYGWLFHNDGPASGVASKGGSSTPEPIPAIRMALYEALNSAVRLIRLFHDVKGQNSTLAPIPQVFLPRHYIYTVYFAALILYHFLTTLPSASAIDMNTARNHIGLCHTSLMQSANGDSTNDRSRLAQNIVSIGEFLKQGRRLPAEYRIESRLGASLFYDAMLKLAVLKAEKGIRAYAADLTQKVDDEKAQQRRVRNNAAISSSPPVADSTIADLQLEEPFVVDPQQWNADGWGWDITMLDPMDPNFDWNALEDWQP